MAKINTAISISSFELIRTQIALILADELASQKILQPTLDLSATIYEERSTAIDASEGTVISVLLNSFSETQKSQYHSVNESSFYISIYTESPSTAIDRGDMLARVSAQRFIGIIRGILENPAYKYLGFDSKFIQRVQVSNVEMAAPQEDPSAANTAFGRITIMVNSSDQNIPQDARDIENFQAQLKIGDTDKGHKLEYEYTV